MSDEQFEAFQKLLGDKAAYQDITPKSLIQVAAPSSGFMYCRGGQIPNGTKLRATYLSRDYQAEVKGGRFWFEGKAFDSPSNAARAITKTAVNGWKFWEYWDEANERWISLVSLRSKKK